MRQFHYVFLWDEETKQWEVDYNVSLNYDSGHIWDKKEYEWSAEYLEDIEAPIVGEALRKLNA